MGSESIVMQDNRKVGKSEILPMGKRKCMFIPYGSTVLGLLSFYMLVAILVLLTADQYCTSVSIKSMTLCRTVEYLDLVHVPSQGRELDLLAS